jgi:DNA-binding PadR family transcriptional regulator
MAFRKPGTLLDLERAVLEVGANTGPEGMYGFSLAQQLAEKDGASKLIGHGTLYKVLHRLVGAGLLESQWEDPAEAAEAGRPRRRLYRVTAAGVSALAAVPDPSPTKGRPRVGDALS